MARTFSASFDVGRTNWTPIKLKERISAWWDSFFWRKNGEENIVLAEEYFSNQLPKWEWFRVLVDEKVQFEYAVCGRGNFWIRKEKFADSKISRYVWTGALEKCQTCRELTCCHYFFLQACSFDQLRSGSTQLCSEVDIVGVVVFCTPLSCFSNSRYACNHGYKVVPVHLFNSMLSSTASSSSFSLSSSSSSPSSFSSPPSSWSSSSSLCYI